MNIRFVIPHSPGVRSGNLHTAEHWAGIMEGLGHKTRILESGTASPAGDLCITLHAVKTHLDAWGFRAARPSSPLIVALTGTDIYPRPGDTALDTMRQADRLVVLHDKAAAQLPESLRDRVRVIIQSAEKPNLPRRIDPDRFEVCVVGHLRAVKDPLATAKAAALLPPDSKLHVRHAGGIIDASYAEVLRTPMPRCDFLGELDETAVQDLLVSSRLMVLSSRFEGGARVLGEALVAGTPVLATRIDAVTAVLGDAYPGLFDPGDVEALSGLMSRAENDTAFLESLCRHCEERAPLFDPAREREAWQALLAELC